MTEQELEFWKQVYVAVATGIINRPSCEVALLADAAVEQLRKKYKEVIRPVFPLV